MPETPAAAREGQDLMRLGWMLAETEGRYRLGDDDRLAPEVRSGRARSVLPLSVERTPAEQRIEAERVLTAVASNQSFDVPAMDVGIAREDLDSDTTIVTVYMRALATRLNAARHKRDAEQTNAALVSLNELFYAWDCHIQDALASGPYGQSSAYQLGRGLAETYWALDEQAEPGAYESWDHLLVRRFNTLATLLRRCATMLPDLAAEAITATLEQWRGVAAALSGLTSSQGGRALTPSSSQVDGHEALVVLRQQSGVWRDLLLSNASPAKVVATDQSWKRARSLGPLLRSFSIEVAGLLAGLGLVGAAIVFVALGAPGVPKVVGGTLAAVLGAFGVTSSTFLARTKAVGQGLFLQLNEKISADAVIAAATYLPASYSRRVVSVRQSASAGSARHLGPVVEYDAVNAAPAPPHRGGSRHEPAAAGLSG